MVVEAGGVITDFVGEGYSIYGTEIVASNGAIQEGMLEVLKRDRIGAAKGNL